MSPIPSSRSTGTGVSYPRHDKEANIKTFHARAQRQCPCQSSCSWEIKGRQTCHSWKGTHLPAPQTLAQLFRASPGCLLPLSVFSLFRQISSSSVEEVMRHMFFILLKAKNELNIMEMVCLEKAATEESLLPTSTWDRNSILPHLAAPGGFQLVKHIKTILNLDQKDFFTPRI